MSSDSKPEEAPATGAVAEIRTPLGRSREWLWALGLVTICAMAVGIRAKFWRKVFASDGVFFFDGDSFYHMRRILYSIRNFPSVLELDPYMNFPGQGLAPWPPGFDLPAALMLRAFVGPATSPESVASIERVAAWIPVALGVATVAATGWIGRRLAGPGAGLVAAGMLAVLPAGFRYTRLGFVDHHAAVAFLGVIMLGGLLHLAARNDAGARAWPLWAGAISASLLYVWPGALLHLAIAQLALLVWTLAAPSREVTVSRGLRLAVAHGLTAAALAPYAAGRSFGEFGDFTPLALTSFQPVYFACAAVCLGITGVVWSRTALGETLARRSAAALGVGLAGLLLAFLAIPELIGILGRSAGWFTGQETFNLRIIELQPLLRDRAGGTGMARFYFSVLLFAFPLAWILVVARLEGGGPRWMVGAWSLAFGLATLSQQRFMNTFSAAFCLVWAVALADAWRWAGVVGGGRRAPPLAVRAAIVGLVLAVGVPVLQAHWRSSVNSLLDTAPSRSSRFREAASYLRNHSPSPESTSGELRYGVLCAWGVGHMVRYQSGRPVIQDNFGPYVGRENVEAANRYYAATDEQAALEILDALKVRYVIVDARGAGVSIAYPRASMTRRMVGQSGSRPRGGSDADVPVLPALAHHRLVYEIGWTRERVRIFERVRGARIAGRAPPGTTVRAELRLVSNRKRFFYRTSARADHEGRYRMTVPYSTEAFGAAVEHWGLYRIWANDRSAIVAVPESAVEQGATLVGPSFVAAQRS